MDVSTRLQCYHQYIYKSKSKKLHNPEFRKLENINTFAWNKKLKYKISNNLADQGDLQLLEIGSEVDIPMSQP